MKTAKRLVFVAATIVVVWAVYDAIRVPPDALTRTRMSVLEYRIRDYLAANGHLPTQLTDLPRLDGNRDDKLIDGWGRPIQYEHNNSRVTLTSFGKDGKLNGDDKSADIVKTFAVVD